MGRKSLDYKAIKRISILISLSYQWILFNCGTKMACSKNFKVFALKGETLESNWKCKLRNYSKKLKIRYVEKK